MNERTLRGRTAIVGIGETTYYRHGQSPDAEFKLALQALFQQALLFSPGLRIAGGTDEILRNIIAERVLGLPADIRVDKDIPFNKAPGGR